MKKAKQLLALLMILIFILSGCTSSRNNLNTEYTTDSTSADEAASGNDDDISVNSNIKYNYDFSIYEDGRTFSKEQISVQSEFEAFLSEVFSEQKSLSSVSLHFAIEHPENYGIGDCSSIWGDFDYMDTSGDAAKLNDMLSRLQAFDYDALTYEQQLIYDITKEYIESELSSADYPLFTSAFSPMSGIQGQLPIIFSEYDFREKSDIDDYISILNTSYSYVEKLCEYEKYRMEQGYSLSAVSLEKVIGQCRDFLGAEPNCIRPVFEEKLKAFGSLSANEISAYMADFDRELSGSLKPAFELIISTLTEIKESNVSKGGICNYENGKAFYEYLVKYNTGSSKSVDELNEAMKSEMKSCALGVSGLFIKNPNLDSDMKNYKNALTDPDDMMKKLITALEEDFPKAVTGSYTINYVPESLESTMSPAYYLIPPIDNINRNNIYINRSDEYSQMNLFTTISHEGFPGHMYQTNYFYSLKPHYFRSLFDFAGYTEGWAQYVETWYAYKYSDMDDDLAKAFGYNTSLSFALYCMTDIGVNYMGWDYEKTKAFLGPYTGNNDTAINEIYYTVMDDPCIYLRYYVGYLEIMSLKEAAEEALGSGFDIKEFHRFLLEMGPCQFDIISDRMERWIHTVLSESK